MNRTIKPMTQMTLVRYANGFDKNWTDRKRVIAWIMQEDEAIPLVQDRFRLANFYSQVPEGELNQWRLEESQVHTSLTEAVTYW